MEKKHQKTISVSIIAEKIKINIGDKYGGKKS